MADFDVFSLESYHYILPEELIAQHPPEVRGTSRLMVLNRHGDGVCPIDAVFDNLPEFLPENSLLVVNNSRVVPARLFGSRPRGGKAEMLLLTPPVLLEKSARICTDNADDATIRFEAEAEALLKPGRNIREKDTLDFGELQADVLKKKDFGRHTLRLVWSGSLTDILERAGKLPLPPYIRREQEADDISRYQTLYSRGDKKGSVAAPTAGLHFTGEMRERLLSLGVEWAEVTLHVGYGTFSPVREEDIRRHPMHAEYAEIPPATIEAVRRAKRDGRPVIAVGTTSARTLEGAALACAREGRELFVRDACAAGASSEPCETGWSGWIDIFIYPGFSFRAVDGLVTNFHLPRSSLLMLVSAFAGRERILRAYSHAVEAKYRFFSYGDAMLIR